MPDFLELWTALGGGPGMAATLALAFVSVRLWQQNSLLQEKRIEDQTRFWDRLNGMLKSVETWVSSIKDGIAAVGTKLQALTEEKKELSREIREMRAEVRETRDEVREARREFQTRRGEK